MKLSDIKGEKALDVLADLMDPLSEIFSDEKVKELVQRGNKLGTVKEILKNHKKSTLTVLALLDGENPETYEPSIITIPVKLITLLNDPSIAPFFVLQGRNMGAKSSGSAMGNTEATKTE